MYKWACAGIHDTNSQTRPFSLVNASMLTARTPCHNDTVLAQKLCKHTTTAPACAPNHSYMYVCTFKICISQCALPKKCGPSIPVSSWTSTAAKFGPLSALRYLVYPRVSVHVRTHAIIQSLSLSVLFLREGARARALSRRISSGSRARTHTHTACACWVSSLPMAWVSERWQPAGLGTSFVTHSGA
jgi:hypothetical protein